MASVGPQHHREGKGHRFLEDWCTRGCIKLSVSAIISNRLTSDPANEFLG